MLHRAKELSQIEELEAAKGRKLTPFEISALNRRWRKNNLDQLICPAEKNVHRKRTRAMRKEKDND
jgi:hypothetical protein